MFTWLKLFKFKLVNDISIYIVERNTVFKKVYNYLNYVDRKTVLNIKINTHITYILLKKYIYCNSDTCFNMVLFEQIKNEAVSKLDCYKNIVSSCGESV